MTTKRKKNSYNPARTRMPQPKREKLNETSHDEQLSTLFSTTPPPVEEAMWVYLFENDDEDRNAYPQPARFIYSSPTYSYAYNLPTRKSADHPLSADAGEIGELQVLHMFANAGFNKKHILKGEDVNLPGGGTQEISDGIILVGRTAFMLQIKTRNAEEKNQEHEIRYAKKRAADARDQIEPSLALLKKKGTVSFESLDGERVAVTYDDYDWVPIVVVNYNRFPFSSEEHALTVVNDGPQDELAAYFPAHSLERLLYLSQDISGGGTALTVAYLRRLRYMATQDLNASLQTFLEWLNEIRYVPQTPHWLEATYRFINFMPAVMLTPVAFKKLFYGIDYFLPEQAGLVQYNYANHLSLNVSDYPRRSYMLVGGVLYGFLYYSGWEPSVAQVEVLEAAGQLHERYAEEYGLQAVIVLGVNVLQPTAAKVAGVHGGTAFLNDPLDHQLEDAVRDKIDETIASKGYTRHIWDDDYKTRGK